MRPSVKTSLRIYLPLGGQSGATPSTSRGCESQHTWRLRPRPFTFTMSDWNRILSGALRQKRPQEYGLRGRRWPTGVYCTATSRRQVLERTDGLRQYGFRRKGGDSRQIWSDGAVLAPGEWMASGISPFRRRPPFGGHRLRGGRTGDKLGQAAGS